MKSQIQPARLVPMDRELAEDATRWAADRERERARLKEEIVFALGDITAAEGQLPALRRVADRIARSFGNWCVLQLDDRGGERRITAHTDPEKVAWAEEIGRRWPPQRDAPRGSYAVMRTGRPEWIPEVTEEMVNQSARSPEHLEALRRIRVTSYLCVPMYARQRVIGAMTCISTEADHHYDEADLAFAQQVADRIGLAIDNARLYREAREARETAERLYAAEQAARSEAEALSRVAEALSAAQLDLDTVVQRVTDEATALVGAQFGAFFFNVLGEHAEQYLPYTLSGAPRAALGQFGLPRNTLLFAPTFAGQGIVRIDDVKKDPRYGTMDPDHGMPRAHLPVTSYLAVPVVSRTGPVIGGLFFGHAEPAKFTEQHERVTKALAAHAAVAIDNARLFKEMREAEERQSRLVAELERSIRVSEMFVGTLGHDLRNPLSAIATAASVVLSRADSERVAKPVSRILSSADRMGRMIDQILDFTRVRMGQGIPIKRRRVDLADVCRLVLDELESDPRDATPASLVCQGDTAGIWDEDRLAQMVSNLVGNALQHRQRATPVSLCIDGSRPERVRLTVENRGLIPPELVSVIFEPLRGRGVGKREGSSGLGLGLYISQQIALAHAGSIQVESEPSRGRTLFHLDLPRTPAQAAEQPSESDEKDGT